MTDIELNRIAFTRELERQELSYLRDYYQNLPASLTQKYGTRFIDLEDAGAAITPQVDILAFNRVMGPGLLDSIDENQIKTIIDTYVSAGIPRFFLQAVWSDELEKNKPLLEAEGFYHYNNWVKLSRSTEPIPVAHTNLRIEQTDAGQKDIFADMILTCFEWPADLKPLIAQPVGQPGWRHYFAYDGTKPAACAAMFVRNEFASLAIAATLPDYRGYGAQSVLISRRLRDAAKSGCQWAVVETAEPKPQKPVASYRNLKRLGFEVIYKRPNFLKQLA